MNLCDRVYGDQPSYSVERGFVSSTCDDIIPLILRSLDGEDVSNDTAFLAANYDGTECGDNLQYTQKRKVQKLRRSRRRKHGSQQGTRFCGWGNDCRRSVAKGSLCPTHKKRPRGPTIGF